MGDYLVGGMVAILGLIGLMLGSHALDVEILIFGWSLAAFAVLFIAGLVRRRQGARERRHG